jgi:hypothetical protein
MIIFHLLCHKIKEERYLTVNLKERDHLRNLAIGGRKESEL